LRHGGVLQNTETVELNGFTLKRDEDYSIDYAGGVIYLTRSHRIGDSLHVSYRYSKDAPSSVSPSGGFNGLKVDLLPGALNMNLGFGLAERNANGSISRSNVFGWQNNFTMRGGSAGVFQGGGLTGLFVVDERQAVDSRSNFSSELPAASGPQHLNSGRKGAQGQTQLILQNFSTGFLGGKATGGYQDVSKDFAAFGSVSGADQKTVDQLQKEKGLKRMGFGLTDFGFGGLKLTDDYRNVTDGHAGVSWRDLGAKFGALNASWGEQRVDKTFSRFGDLAEANRTDLQRGAGLDRQTMSLAMNMGKTPAAGALAYSGLTIGDGNGGHLYKRDGSYTSKLLTLDLGDQETQKQFTSFGNLLDPEKPTWQNDGGLHRQWLTLKTDLGRGYTPLLFSQKWVKSDTGQFVASSLGFGAKGWSLTHAEQDIDKGFTAFTAITPADQDASINAIGAMYGPTAPNGQPIKPNAGAERGAFSGTPGMQRRYDAVALEPTKDFKIGVSALDLQGSGSTGFGANSDKGQVETASVSGKNFKFDYRTQDLGTNFVELPKLMGFERQALGTIQGLQRSDMAFSMDMGKGRSLSYSQLQANAAGVGSGLGAAARQVFDFKEKTFEISYNRRAVDNTFTRVNELVDPENNTLATLVGHDENDLKIKGMILPGLKIDGQFFNDSNASLKELTQKHNLTLNYDGKTTSFAYTHLDQRSNDPLSLLLATARDTFSVSQQFGPAKLHVAEDHSLYDGTQTAGVAGISMKDATSRTVGIEVKVSPTTNLATEQTQTSYSDGETSSVRNDSVSETLNKRAGVTLSQSVVDNPSGQQNTQTKRNYGFWYDLGKGLVLNYGYVRQLDTTGFSTLNSIVSLGQAPAASAKPDQLGALPTGSYQDFSFAGGYAANQFQTPGPNGEATRTQSFSNVRLGTIKPMKLGSITDFRFNFSYDTAADNFNWIRENRAFGLGGKYGTFGFGFDYRSQMDSVGDRAVDRLFNFTTDTSAKKFLSASVSYKVRTLPNSVKSLVPDQNVMIRNYDFTVRPTSRLAVSSQLMTNPEVTNGNAMLGSITQGSRVDRWKLTYASTKDTDLGGSWEETINEANKAVGQTSGFNLTLFKSTLPMKFFYGFENLLGNVPHHSTERWSLQFDQRAGPHQSLNFFVGNVSYGYTLSQGQSAHNLTARVDYVIKF
jgi:hypothetical protein